MDINNVGREEEVCTAATTMVIHVQRAPAETAELVDDVEVLADIAEREPELQESLGQLVSNMKAKETLANYNTVQRRFQDFCEGRHYSHHEITEQAVIHYLAELTKQQVSHVVLCQVKLALVMMEEMYSEKSTAFTARADRMMEGAKRIAAERRESVKKSTAVDLELLKSAVERYITPHSENIYRIDVYKFRTIYRLVVEYFTFCRFSDYNKLQARHMIKVGNNMEVVFLSSKNDQMHEGQKTMMAGNETDFCPAKFSDMYFRRFGFKMGAESGDTSFLHPRIRKRGGAHVADGRVVASGTRAREELQHLLRDMEVDGQGVTDKSFKMLGVTKTLEAGAAAEEVALHGRWRSLDMPHRYKHNSQEFKLKTATKVPH